jgi:hypothetical protein
MALLLPGPFNYFLDIPVKSVYFLIMSSRFKTTINIIALFVIIGFAVSVYFLCRFHDAKSAKRQVVYLPKFYFLCRFHDAKSAKRQVVYLPKFAPEFLKDIAREEYILVEIEPNYPRISKEWIKEHINQQEF